MVHYNISYADSVLQCPNSIVRADNHRSPSSGSKVLEPSASFVLTLDTRSFFGMQFPVIPVTPPPPFPACQNNNKVTVKKSHQGEALTYSSGVAHLSTSTTRLILVQAWANWLDSRSESELRGEGQLTIIGSQYRSRLKRRHIKKAAAANLSLVENPKRRSAQKQTDE